MFREKNGSDNSLCLERKLAVIIVYVYRESIYREKTGSDNSLCIERENWQ